VLIDEHRAAEAAPILNTARTTTAKYGVVAYGLTCLIDCHLALALVQLGRDDWREYAARALPLLSASKHPLATRLRAAGSRFARA
jgi:hypothetical protein